MKFRIIEEAWGVNRKTGERKVRRTAERIFTPEAGQIIEFPLGRRRFGIVSADEERVVLRVQCENSADEKEFIIECGTGGFYNPRSCDGGYRYLFELTRMNRKADRPRGDAGERKAGIQLQSRSKRLRGSMITRKASSSARRQCRTNGSKDFMTT